MVPGKDPEFLRSFIYFIVLFIFKEGLLDPRYAPKVLQNINSIGIIMIPLLLKKFDSRGD